MSAIFRSALAAARATARRLHTSAPARGGGGHHGGHNDPVRLWGFLFPSSAHLPRAARRGGPVAELAPRSPPETQKERVGAGRGRVRERPVGAKIARPRAAGPRNTRPFCAACSPLKGAPDPFLQEHYIHAPEMYDLPAMKNRELKVQSRAGTDAFLRQRPAPSALLLVVRESLS